MTPIDQPVALVVDDEWLLRQFLSDVLEEAGFVVLEAATGEEAVAILEARAENIILVYSDVRMPQMSGIDLLRIVEQRWPHIHLVLTSGDHRLSDAEVPDHGVFVPKPATVDDVREAIHRAMG